MPPRLAPEVSEETVRLARAGVPLADIAERMGVTKDAIDSRLRRAGVELQQRPKRNPLECAECGTRLRRRVPSGMCGFCEIETLAAGNLQRRESAAFPSGGDGA